MPSVKPSDSFTIAKILAPDTKERRKWTLPEEKGNTASEGQYPLSRPGTVVDFSGVLQCCDPESKQHRYCQHPDSALAISEGSFLPGVIARLCQDDEWRKLHNTGCEMTITKVGRRMYPPFRLTNIRGLEENATYRLWLEFVQYSDDKYRYSYHGSTWVKAGQGERSRTVGAGVYIHPDSPATGRHWMTQTASFEKMKMTNCRDKAGMVPLSSMQKYLPLVHLEKVTSSFGASGAPQRMTFLFPQTSFMAVTAYQNQDITQIKINHNPFAKGFRDKENSRIRQGDDNRPVSSGCVTPYSPRATETETFIASGSPFPVKRTRAAANSSHPAGRRRSVAGRVPSNTGVLYPGWCPPGLPVFPPTLVAGGLWSLRGYPDCGYPGVGSPVSTPLLPCPWQIPVLSSDSVSDPARAFGQLCGPLSWTIKGCLSGGHPSTETTEGSSQQQLGPGRSQASLTIALPLLQTPEPENPQRFLYSTHRNRQAEGSRSSSAEKASGRQVVGEPGKSELAGVFPPMPDSPSTEAPAERDTIRPGGTRSASPEVLSSVWRSQSRSSSFSSDLSSPQSLSNSPAVKTWSRGEHSATEVFHSMVPDESSKVWVTMPIHGRQSCTDPGRKMAEPLLGNRQAITSRKSILRQHDAISPCTSAVRIGYASDHGTNLCHTFATSLIRTSETLVSDHGRDSSSCSSAPSLDFGRSPKHCSVNVSEAKTPILSPDSRLSGSEPTTSRSSTPKTDLSPAGSSFPGDLSPCCADLAGQPESIQRCTQAAGTSVFSSSQGLTDALSPEPAHHYSPLACLSQMEKSFETAWAASSQPKRLLCWELPRVSRPISGRLFGPGRRAARLSQAQIRLAKRQRLRLPRKWGGEEPIKNDEALDLSRRDQDMPGGGHLEARRLKTLVALSELEPSLTPHKGRHVLEV